MQSTIQFCGSDSEVAPYLEAYGSFNEKRSYACINATSEKFIFALKHNLFWYKPLGCQKLAFFRCLLTIHNLRIVHSTMDSMLLCIFIVCTHELNGGQTHLHFSSPPNYKKIDSENCPLETKFSIFWHTVSHPNLTS